MGYVVNTSRCPLLLTRDLSAFGFRLGGVSRLYFALHQTSRSRGGGKVGISHRGEISKELWEAVETWFRFAPVSIAPSFPRRLLGFVSGRPWLSNRPTTCGP